MAEDLKEKEIVESLCLEFDIDKLKEYLLQKFPNFNPKPGTLPGTFYEDGTFNDVEEVIRIGDVEINNYYSFCVFAIKYSNQLTSRTSKKKQFEIAKKLLRNLLYDAGFFVFFDQNGNFRFSLVYSNPIGTKREYSFYKRYTYYVEKGKPYRTIKKALIEMKTNTLEDIISAFSTLPLTKEFYDEIQRWYAWAIKEAVFPGGKIEENIIRLITRLIFVWFLKERGIIPEQIFDPNFLKNIVKDFGSKDYYYNVILQNLFFATLNNYPEERKFAKNESFPINRTEFMVKNLFRYQDKILIDEDEFLKIFEGVPFINGGLFECLDDFNEDGYGYIDGFSRNENRRAKLPDYLFFSDEKEVDLSRFYEDSKLRKVRGLINILKDYNWTVDESSPVDVEVSLDPELLGHIFENLLAVYNDEIQTTARKATGSYYTPKEIVDFMVEQALIEYFTDKTRLSKEKLEELFSYDENVVNLSEEERDDLMKAIRELKIIDPAVGSGAFPMGILHKLLFLLTKIDLEGRWGNDYEKKLYLIENSIYGVDIQPIAIQICKLRFFLSLIIDVEIDRNRRNYGIEPLPNLETKFVVANTLFKIKKPEVVQKMSLVDYVISGIKRELKELRFRYFRVKTSQEKKRIREKANYLRQELSAKLKSIGFEEEEAMKIANFDIFSQTGFADWFDSEWMFGVDDGFDIVIGNPPYIRQEKIKEFKPILKDQGYKVFDSTADIYVYFYERGYKLLKEEGVLCYISSNKWMRAKYGKNLRSFLKKNTFLITLVDFGGYRVFEQTVDTCIVLFKKLKSQELLEGWKFSYCIVPSDCSEIIEYIRSNYRFMEQNKLSDDAWTLADDKELVLKEKIERVGKPLKEWDVKIYRGVLTGFNEAFIIDTQTRNRILANCRTEDERKRTEEIIKPVLRGRDIHKWRYKWEGFWIIKIEAGWTNKHCKKENPEEFFKNIFSSLYNYFLQFKDYKGKGKGLLNRDDQGDYWWELRHCDYYSEFEKEKIVWQRVTKNFSFCFVPKGLYTLDSIAFMTGENLRFILGILNSKVIDFYVKTYVHQLSDTGFLLSNQYVERIPIPIITLENEEIAKRIEILVNKIIDITSCKDYESDLNKQSEVKTLENEINALVYKLYNLTTEEIQIIEKNYN